MDEDFVNFSRPATLSDQLRCSVAAGYMSIGAQKSINEAADLLDILYVSVRELVNRIEKCGTSIELTNAVSLASDIASSIGNKYNPSDRHALSRVKCSVLKDEA